MRIALLTTLLLVSLGCRVLYGQQPVALVCSELDESSGLAISQLDPGNVWTHNDSGSPPRLFLFNRQRGDLLATFELAGARCVDWEDMCSFQLEGKSYLAIGDVGDNNRRRQEVLIHVLEEPTLTLGGVEPGNVTAPQFRPITGYSTIRVRFPEGAVDCEALAFDPLHRRWLMATKEFFRSRIFSVPFDLNSVPSLADVTPAPSELIQAELLQTISVPIVTAADISADGQMLALCTYGPAYLLPRVDGRWSEKSMVRLPLPKRRQGEAIGFADDNTLLISSEFAPTPLWTINLRQHSN
ncbi:MAG: hypothetical protein KF752_18885 [Pirellulaceae bacterium]|nr:hypothetical protein [Pirellulaceae bacterium]